MYERFTDRVRFAMSLANQEAIRFNSRTVCTEHVLIGLIKQSSDIAAQVLNRFNVDLRSVRLQAESLIQPYDYSDLPPVTCRVPHSSQVAAIFPRAIEESTALGVTYVGTEAILLGILRDPESVASRILAPFGVSLQSVREIVRTIVNQNTNGVPISTEPRATVTYPEAVRATAKLDPTRQPVSVQRWQAVIGLPPGPSLQILRQSLLDMLAEIDARLAAESVQPDAVRPAE